MNDTQAQKRHMGTGEEAATMYEVFDYDTPVRNAESLLAASRWAAKHLRQVEGVFIKEYTPVDFCDNIEGCAPRETGRMWKRNVAMGWEPFND